MKKCLVIFLSSILSMIVFSCKNNTSETNQITANKFNCTVNEKRAQYYYETYGMNNPNITVNSKEAATSIRSFWGVTNLPTSAKDPESIIKQAFRILSNVPEEYIKYALDKNENNITVHLIDYLVNNNRVGLTVWSYKSYENRTVRYPTTISHAHLVVLAHEFGHASEGYQWEKDPEFQQKLSQLASIMYNNSYYRSNVSRYLKSYTNQPKESLERELFAELFDTWYCSSAAREFLKKGLPKFYDFAKDNLLPPVSED